MEEGGAVDGDAGGARQGGEELEPVIGRLQDGAVVDLEHALHLSLGDERDGVVAGEVLAHSPAEKSGFDLGFVQGRDGNGAPLEGGGAGIALPDHDR